MINMYRRRVFSATAAVLYPLRIQSEANGKGVVNLRH